MQTNLSLRGQFLPISTSLDVACFERCFKDIPVKSTGTNSFWEPLVQNILGWTWSSEPAEIQQSAHVEVLICNSLAFSACHINSETLGRLGSDCHSGCTIEPKGDATEDHNFDLPALQSERTNKQNTICWSHWPYLWGIISNYPECSKLSFYYNIM